MADTYAIGTVSVEHDSPIVRLNVGDGVWLPGSVADGDDMMIGGLLYIIATLDGMVDDRYQVTLTTPFAGATGAEVSYTIRRVSPNRTTARQIDTSLAQLIDKIGSSDDLRDRVLSASDNLDALHVLNGVANNIIMFSGPGGLVQVPVTDLVNGVIARVEIPAERDEYDMAKKDFSVFVADIGGGRGGLYWKLTDDEADWSDPAYWTGPIGPPAQITIGAVNTVPSGEPANASLTGEAPNFTLGFDIPAGTILTIGDTITVAPDQPAAVIPTAITGGYRLDFALPQGATGNIDGVTAFWQGRITADTTAAAARIGLGAVGVAGSQNIDGSKRFVQGNLRAVEIQRGGAGLVSAIGQLSEQDALVFSANAETSTGRMRLLPGGQLELAGALKPVPDGPWLTAARPGQTTWVGNLVSNGFRVYPEGQATNTGLVVNADGTGTLGTNPIAVVHTGTSSATTDFPIGHIVFVDLDSTSVTRNAAMTVRFGGTSAEYTTGGSGAILAGTYRARGNYAIGSGRYGIAQRTAL